MSTEYLDFDLVDRLAVATDPELRIDAVNVLNFRTLFKDSIRGYHMFSCRVCHTFTRVQVAFVDIEDPHKAVTLCGKHYLQFKSYYRFALNEYRPIIEDLPEFPFADEVVAALVKKDGFPFSYSRAKYDPSEYPLAADLSMCDFFVDYHKRDTMIKKIKKGVAKQEHREYIERIGREAARVYGLDHLPFPGPWENIDWWEPARGTHERES